MASGYRSPLSVRSGRWPLRVRAESNSDSSPDSPCAAPEGTRQLLTEVTARLNRLESPVNSASAVELVHSNSDIIGVVPYVGTTNICPDIALPRPGQPGNPGDLTVLGTAVGSIRRSQRLASQPLVSYSSGNAHTRGASDYEAEPGIRPRDAVALPTSLFALRPRPSSSVTGNLREDLPDRVWGAKVWLITQIFFLLISHNLEPRIFK